MHAAGSLGLNKLNDGIGMICREFFSLHSLGHGPSQL